jgi:hypothetical protein
MKHVSPNAAQWNVEGGKTSDLPIGIQLSMQQLLGRFLMHIKLRVIQAPNPDHPAKVEQY